MNNSFRIKLDESITDIALVVTDVIGIWNNKNWNGLVYAESEYLNLDPKNLDALLVELGQRGCNEVLVEAGAKVVGSFVKAGLWDEWIAYVAPKIMGDSSAHVVDAAYESMTQVPEAEVVNTKMFGNDVRLTLRNSRQ